MDRGIASKNVKISLTIWHISTPRRPKNVGKIKMRGRKNKPCLAAATIDARTAMPMDWRSILLITIPPLKVKLIQEKRSAAIPTAVTSGSPFRNSSIS